MIVIELSEEELDLLNKSIKCGIQSYQSNFQELWEQSANLAQQGKFAQSEAARDMAEEAMETKKALIDFYERLEGKPYRST